MISSLNWYVDSRVLFQPLMIPFKVPEEDNPRPQDPVVLPSHGTSVASVSIHERGESNLDPAVEEAIAAIKSSRTSRTKLSKIPRELLLSACSSFRIEAEETPLGDLRKAEILSKVHNWVCV